MKSFAGDQLLGAMQLLESLSDAQRIGATPSIETLASETGLGLARTSRLLEDMLQAGWVVTSDTGNWLLAIRCSELRLRDLLEGLCLSPKGLIDSRHPLGMALARRLARLHGPFDDPVSELLSEPADRTRNNQIG